jgi:hypothetical protein
VDHGPDGDVHITLSRSLFAQSTNDTLGLAWLVGYPSSVYVQVVPPFVCASVITLPERLPHIPALTHNYFMLSF